MQIKSLFKPLVAALTLLISPSLPAATYVQNVLDAGPAAYWRFETVNDTSLSNGFVNTFQGDATVTAAGQGVPLNGIVGNHALLLDGNGDSVRTGVTNQFTFASSGTFMTWVNFAQLPSVENRHVELIMKSHWTSPLDWVMDPNNRLYGYAGDYPPVYCDFNPELATNTWYHLAFTFDNAGKFKRLYVNGVLVGDLPLNPNLTGNTDEIMIGNSPVFTDRSFNGRMDEVALFNRALTGAEIQALFASAGVSTPAPQPAVRLTLEFPHEINALERGQNEYFGLGLNLTLIPAPFSSTNALFSTHSNHSILVGGQYGGVFNGGGWLYNSLGEAVQEATNGLWTLVLNVGATNEQTYRFKVSVTGLATNDFAALDITSPVDGSEGNLSDVAFNWTQSQPWLINNLDLDGPTYARATVPPGSTSWTNAPTLNLGKHDFNLYLRTNAASWVSLTTPTNSANQTLEDWDGSSQLVARRGIRFRVGYFIPPPPGLQAHLRFDDENFLGLDSSGKDNHPYISYYGDMPTYDAGGMLNGSASFTYGGWLEFNDAFTPTLGADFTVAVWVQTTQTQGNDDDQGIYGAGIVGGYVGDWSAKNTIPITINGSKAGFMTGDQNGEQTLHSTVNINNGGPDWVHVAVTRVQSTGEKRIYINGVLNASETGNTELLDGSERVRVGYGGYTTYNGRLDDLQIYSAALSQADIAYLYANPGATVTNPGSASDLVAYYDFDEGTVVAPDVSGNGNNIVHAGNFGGSGPAIGLDTIAGAGSVSFDGGSYLTASSNLLGTIARDFSISVWVKTSQSVGSPGDMAYWGAAIVSADIVTGDAGDAVPIALTAGQVAFNTGDGFTDQTLNSSATVNDNAWHHLVVTRSQATGQKQIYIDGAFDNSELGTTALLNGPQLLTIGAKSDAAYPDPASPDSYGSQGYEGFLDDLQIYKRVLSPSEIAYLHAHPGLTVPSTTIPLGVALNAPNLTWTTSGDAFWFGQTANTHDNISAAQSGDIGDGQESWMETTVTGPGTLSFWWNVSSEDGYDYLEFLVDGDWQDDITGDWGWDQRSYEIEAGEHTLRWRYYKDGSSSDGLDAGFLDEVSYTPTIILPPPVITLNPFNQTNRPGYQVALLAAATNSAPITWEWFKIGSVPPISGATNALYIPANSGTAGVAGSYFAVASSTNGSATTTAATVTFQNAALPPDWSRAFRTSFTNNPADTTSDINLASLFDSSGNIYTVGSVNGTNVFGTNILISANGREGSSFLKQTATGTPIWGRCMTNNGNGGSFPRGIAAAPGDGFYAVGMFFGTNWLGTNQLVDTAGASTYLARFDANGNNLWLRTIVGTNTGFPTHHALVSDPAGNVTLSALIQGYTSFGTTNLLVEGQRGVLAQYDPNGNLRWVQLPSAWPDYLVYTAGRIYGTMGGGATNYIGGVTNVSDRRRALFALDATTGQGLWVQAFSVHKDQSSPTYFGDNNATVAVSGTNVFVVGTAYGNNATFGPFTLNFPDTKGQYFARYDTNGNAQLATSFGSQYTWPWAALADASGNVYVGCDFDTYSVFGSNLIAAPFYETVQYVGTIDVRIPGQTCVAKFDRNGNALWARPAQSPSSYLNLRDITLAPDGVWACGFFTPIGNFGTNTIYGGNPPYHRSGYLARITDGSALPMPVILVNVQATAGNFSFQFATQAGFTYFVESRPDAAAGLWTPRTNLAGDGSLKTVTMPATNAPQFFRVKTQ
jgi:hypothetical protein